MDVDLRLANTKASAYPVAALGVDQQALKNHFDQAGAYRLADGAGAFVSNAKPLALGFLVGACLLLVAYGLFVANPEPTSFTRIDGAMAHSGGGFNAGIESDQAAVRLLQSLPASAAGSRETQYALLENIERATQAYHQVEPLVIPSTSVQEHPQLALLSLAPKPSGGSHTIKSEALKSTPVNALADESESKPVEGSAHKPASLGEVATTPVLVQANASVKPSGSSQERAVLRQAKSQVSAGQESSAVVILEHYLRRAPESWAVAKALVALYARHTHLGSIDVSLLEQLPIATQAWAQASVLNAQGKPELALVQLQNVSPKVVAAIGVGRSDFYQLKAAVYHRLEQYPEAINLYRELLGSASQVSPRKQGAYWLGLATSLEAVGNQDALRAYLRARRFHQKHRQVLAYIDQRIGALQVTARSAGAKMSAGGA